MAQSDHTQSFDWTSLWKELDWDDDLRREHAIRVRLRQRAEQYASEISPEHTLDSQTALHVLAFSLGREYYGVDVGLVRAVRPAGKVTPVPGTPSFYTGVVNIRGQVVTVIDLRLFFNMSADPNQPPGELVVVNTPRLELGLLAHHVRDVETVPLTEIEPMDDVRYARGVRGDGLVLLDIARLFEDDRLFVGGSDD